MFGQRWEKMEPVNNKIVDNEVQRLASIVEHLRYRDTKAK